MSVQAAKKTFETTRKRPNWILSAIVTVTGVLLLWAAAVVEAYWQSIFINVGAALLLFAALALLQDQLMRKTEAANEILRKDQEELYSILHGQLPVTPQAPLPRQVLVDQAVSRTGRAILRAGFIQDLGRHEGAGASDTLFFASPDGQRTWELGCGPSLFHVLLLGNGQARTWPPNGRAGAILRQDGDQLSSKDERLLMAFESEAYRLIHEMVNLP
ncbi:hypothetical protein [Kitasatospora sp. DSM 101779]|uniref:hypothetical protein n=1 Tax=Kitasatospora sp. DSM 101779 TaxID=2853165 RepID=UPI0021D7F977|nr:hypothetical protein [Kitasatospora sp. DSM 101779]MCU7824791.1 hypothetical protein [Kitasatospora sp. DSM 101779]